MPNVKGQASVVLVIAATHDEIKSITHAIRQDLKGTGELKPGADIRAARASQLDGSAKKADQKLSARPDPRISHALKECKRTKRSRS